MNIKNIATISIMIFMSFFVLSCGKKNKTITLSNISIDVPEDFKEGFLDDNIPIDKDVIEFYQSYGVERRTGIYTIVYKKYNIAYTGVLNLQNTIDSTINNLKYNRVIKEFQVVSQGPVGDSSNKYQILSSFYYGPNKTYHKAFIMLHDNGILQILAMYNANSKKDNKLIDNIINSVRINDNNNN